MCVCELSAQNRVKYCLVRDFFLSLPSSTWLIFLFFSFSLFISKWTRHIYSFEQYDAFLFIWRCGSYERCMFILSNRHLVLVLLPLPLSLFSLIPFYFLFSRLLMHFLSMFRLVSLLSVISDFVRYILSQLCA